MENSSPPPEGVHRLELYETKLTATHQERDDANQPPVRGVITLKQMLDKYMFALGYENAHLLEVLVVLMTTGKVCVEFRSYNERLELQDLSNMMTRHGTVQLFNEYLASVKADKKVVLGAERTQRITVQLPKTVGAAPRNMPATPRNMPAKPGP